MRPRTVVARCNHGDHTGRAQRIDDGRVSHRGSFDIVAAPDVQLEGAEAHVDDVDVWTVVENPVESSDDVRVAAENICAVEHLHRDDLGIRCAADGSDVSIRGHDTGDVGAVSLIVLSGSRTELCCSVSGAAAPAATAETRLGDHGIPRIGVGVVGAGVEHRNLHAVAGEPRGVQQIEIDPGDGLGQASTPPLIDIDAQHLRIGGESEQARGVDFARDGVDRGVTVAH
jgi:hypothetical protein